MVNVRHFQPGAELDAEAMEQFQSHWSVYRRLVDNDYCAHAAAYGRLHDILLTLVRPFRFVDLACGDARETVAALQGTRVAHYLGVDLSDAALRLAASTVERLPCAAELDERDFKDALEQMAEPVDVVWFGLSLHHLQHDDKLVVMRSIRRALRDDGLFVFYEPFLHEGEDRAGFMRRFETNREAWTALDPQEWRVIRDHVTECDFPETASEWQAMAHAAGFARTQQLMTDSREFLAMFRCEER